MRKEKEVKEESEVKKHKNLDKGQIFVRVMAGLLAVVMVAGTAVTLIYPLIRG